MVKQSHNLLKRSRSKHSLLAVISARCALCLCDVSIKQTLPKRKIRENIRRYGSLRDATLVCGGHCTGLVDRVFHRLAGESTHMIDSNELATLRQKLKDYEARIEELERLTKTSDATPAADNDSAAVGISTQNQTTEAE